MIDKAAMRKADGRIDFAMTGDTLGTRVVIEPRTGDRWRVTILDDANLTEHVCHVQDLHTDTCDPLELLRLALNAYREYRESVTA